MQELRGAQAVVTGAASGIGRAISLALAREGTHLYLVDVEPSGLESVAKQAESVAKQAESPGVEVRTGRFDLADAAAVSACAEAILAAERQPRLLVNNAGVAWRGSARRMPHDEVERLLAVNLLAPVRLTQRLLPTLLEQPDPHVLNVCSLAGLVAIRGLALYSTSKFGLVGYSQALRRDHGDRLGVTALCPGWVATPLLEAGNSGRRHKRKRRSQSPEYVAERALEAIRADRSLVVLSPVAKLLWWAHRIHPGLRRRRR
jgi:3-oxoacyl-[acyl-carrier protein] reductase